MTETFGPFDAADREAPDRVYTSAAFARLIKTMMRDGVVNNDGDELAVSPSVPAAMSVSVGTGMALIQGRYYINDAALPLPVDAAPTVTELPRWKPSRMRRSGSSVPRSRRRTLTTRVASPCWTQR